MHGSETWPRKVEHELKLGHTEMSMIRWMYVISLRSFGKPLLVNLPFLFFTSIQQLRCSEIVFS